MGCASSFDGVVHSQRNHITVRCASYDAPDAHPALAAAEQTLHAAADFGSYVTPDDPHYEAVEDYEHFAARHGAYASSSGGIEDEPSAFARSVTISVRVASARLIHGIDGDPCQFAAEPELAHTIDGSIRKTVRWLESCEAAVDTATDDDDPPFVIPPAVAVTPAHWLPGDTSCGGGGGGGELGGVTSPVSALRIATSGRSFDTTADCPTRRPPSGTLPVYHEEDASGIGTHVPSPSSASSGVAASSAELA